MRPLLGKWRSALALIGVSVGVSVGVLVWVFRSPAPQAAATDAFPVPAYSATPFLNAEPGVAYIGTDACANCHRDKHASYLHTAHSRALADVDPSKEPPDGSFVHKTSGRSYRVYREGKQLRHEEVLRTADGHEIARVDLPVRYLVGSGNFSRTYLVEVDGFLHESPITWYASKKAWAMSPGYDQARHQAFERPVGTGCLHCHSGQVAEIGDSPDRLAFQEKAIGCESCHGPGALHAEHQRTGQHVLVDADWTIVNPSRLSRSLSEAICASCHLAAAATIPLRGRQLTDFRPGRPVSDYWIDFTAGKRDGRMTVVGHIDQLRSSRCYANSPEMTCVTCHNPHRPVKAQDATAFYRDRCLQCHTTQSCHLDQAQRLKKDAADNCVACHMPRGDTDIPHIAFTHHRIGRHPLPPADTSSVPELIPADDAPRLTALDRQRNLGLAYVDTMHKTTYAAYADEYQQRARLHLHAVHEAGLRDAGTVLGLAIVNWRVSPADTVKFARLAMDATSASPGERTMAMMLVADSEFRAGNFDSAIDVLQKLVRLRRFADDWRLLGLCYLQTQRLDQAVSALNQALAIRPDRAAAHFALAEAHRRLGNRERAAEHEFKGQWLARHDEQ